MRGFAFNAGWCKGSTSLFGRENLGSNPSPAAEMFYYVYILRSSKDKKLYIGFTDNLRRRFSEHNQGKQKPTKPRGPLKLIFYEAYLNKGDALRREKYFN